MEQTVHTFYKFAELPDHAKWKEELREIGERQGVTGTVILANEGINGTISGEEKGLDQFLGRIMADPRFADLPIRSMITPKPTFYRLRVIIRPEIVTLGDPSVLPSNGSGKYVEPEEWNALIADPEIEVIDVRNDYEVAIGTFERAVNPRTRTFGEWAEFVRQRWASKEKRKVAMFCTGGIRCEKASAHLVQNGFEEVYHLRGGILHYLEKIKPEQSKWSGECFVFDHRVSVVHGLEDGRAKLCFSCRWPLSDADLASPEYEDGVSCPRCAKSLTAERKASLRERHRQVELARQRNTRHIGKKMPSPK